MTTFYHFIDQFMMRKIGHFEIDVCEKKKRILPTVDMLSRYSWNEQSFHQDTIENRMNTE